MSRAPAPDHRPAIELGRFVAAFGIVVAHALPQMRWCGQVSLFFFVMLTAFLSGKSFLRAPQTYRWSQRVRRLVLPWMFWCGIFHVAQWKISRPPVGFLEIRDPWSLLSGPTYHLWFLPFLVGATALVQPFGLMADDDTRLALMFAATAGAALPLFALHAGNLVPAPLSQWALVLPVYVWALLFALAGTHGRSAMAAAGLAAITGAALVATQAETGGAEIWPLFLPAAAGLLAVLWRLPCRGMRFGPLGNSAFGIYLVHPLALLLGYKLFGADADRWGLALFAFALSCAIVAAMQRLPGARTLI